MNVHKNARTTPLSRGVMVRRVLAGEPVAQIAAGYGVSERTVCKWLARWRTEGAAGLADRSSQPRRQRRLASERVAAIERLRRQRMTSPAIARALAMPVSTVGLVLRRLGLHRLKALDPAAPVIRYQRQRPGELIHIDTKKLGRIDGIGHRITGDRRGHRARGVGWEHLHVAVDDASRLAYTEILPADTGEACAGFLARAGAWFAHLGVRVERVMTDNAFCYVHRRYREALTHLGLRHVRIRPYTPRTNGKAERFIQTALREWAYAKPYRSSRQRAGALSSFLAAYNTTRPHTAHGRRPPISRLSA